MAITHCGDWGITRDSRYKAWGKKVTADRVNLTARSGGFALGGDWAKWDDSVAIGNGEYLVVAAETGSRKSHSYRYRLIAGGEVARLIEEAERQAVIAAALAAGDITEGDMARQENDRLYEYALYISLVCSQTNVSPCEPNRTEELKAERAKLLQCVAEIDAELLLLREAAIAVEAEGEPSGK